MKTKPNPYILTFEETTKRIHKAKLKMYAFKFWLAARFLQGQREKGFRRTHVARFIKERVK